MYISVNQALKRRFLGFLKNTVSISIWAFNIVLRIYYKIFFIYLAIDEITKKASRARVRCSNSIEELENLLKSISREVDLENINLNKLIKI